ncbi:MAG: hypothetical protein ACTHK2_07830 [Dokdonella sp.]|uniref:hypothetical protein n=1 Tax=Dokdonella sp. TaxID=2291710 RepID=UPI003F7EF817
MSNMSGPNGSWPVVATVEVDDDELIARILPRVTPGFRFERASAAPKGFVWIDIHVDFGLGAEHATHVARSVVDELASCGFRSFRIVAGAAYLDLAGDSHGEGA